MAAKKPFDVSAFIKGVQRPQRVVSLCTDVTIRERVDALMAALAALPQVEDESLAGDHRRDALVADLRAVTDDTTAWTAFTIQAPTHAGRMAFMSALADMDDDTSRGGAVTLAEAALLVNCLTAVDGQPVTLTDDDAMGIIGQWPDELTRELVDAINDLGGVAASVPFSRRVSETLTPPQP